MIGAKKVMGQLLVDITLFGLLTWLGLYLPVQAPRRLLLWLAGLAQLSLAGALALFMLSLPATAVWPARLAQFCIFLSAFFCLAVMAALTPGYGVWRRRWLTQRRAMIMAWAGMLGVALAVGLLASGSGRWLSLLPLVVLAGSSGLSGTAVAIIHAADQGEAWLAPFLRSFDYAFFMAVLFGGQVVLIMAYALGVSRPLLLLLLGTVTAAIVVQVFSDPAQAALDRIAFFNAPTIRRQRSFLRAESSAAQRVDRALDVLAMDEPTFARHTRQALSHMGDLPKLAASPLTNLPLVAARLREDGRADSTLLRAQELKRVLTESIARLKPPGDAAFSTTDAWRYYNALYFPYVVGLRPYSRRYYFYEDNGAGETAVPEALAWFRTQVPERTLHNWQNTAAQLVARDLRERSQR